MSLVFTEGVKVVSTRLGDISKPEYFEKEVQNGYQGTLRTGPIGHVQLLRHCNNLATTRLSSNNEAAERNFYVQSGSC